MDIDSLANSITYSQEEQDLLKWIKKTGTTKIKFGQKVTIQKIPFYIVGGTLKGNIYLQKFPANISKLHIRYDDSKPKIIVFHSLLNVFQKN